MLREYFEHALVKPFPHPQGDRRLRGGERVSGEHTHSIHATLTKHPHSTHKAFKTFTKHSRSLSHQSHNLPARSAANFSTENPRARLRKSDPTGQFPRTHLHGPERGEEEKRREEKKKHTNLTPQACFQESLSIFRITPLAEHFPVGAACA